MNGKKMENAQGGNKLTLSELSRLKDISNLYKLLKVPFSYSVEMIGPMKVELKIRSCEPQRTILMTSHISVFQAIVFGFFS